MKIFENTCEFNYPWDQVTAANWCKYPNEMSTHVIAVDVLRRELDPTNSILTTERLITCKQSIPKWLNCLIGGKEVSYVREVSTVDLNEKTLTLRSVNLTMNNLLKVFETVIYQPDEINPLITVFKQQAQITAYATFQKICNKIEDWSIERFDQNAQRGKIGFEKVLKIFTQQIEQNSVEIMDKVVNIIDELSIDKIGGIVDDSIDNVSKKTEELLQDTEIVKNSKIIHQYYDLIKNAFKRE
ncbi:hypothetical protein WICMUC_001342 [Wickerhamomyces mucosus]|uniref:PRELI/MSF1 domain-containing protein n=1 Tax=Wickerhamomyces mucosus TaxID=1378264 RepID=A0A9P8PXC8_9ASCO|nr:hypothetical protein WICMUC_001342 [Wickerhamomyces mucosus]